MHILLGVLTPVMVCRREAANDTAVCSETVAAIERYNRGVALAVAKANGTRELFEHRLVGEEAHADWLESQIARVGVENYLATQIQGD
jgi:bacterioferritin (cytochrome b1)